MSPNHSKSWNGWVVRAKADPKSKGRGHRISGSFATEQGAKDYLALYQKQNPGVEAWITQDIK